MRKLQGIVDAGDSFAKGHGIVKARTYNREIPTWARSQTEIRKIILRAFPKLATNDRQREGAKRWASVIHLYFRMGYTDSQVAHEIGSTRTKIQFVIRSIYRVSKGLRANGTGFLSGVRGRPRKKRAVQSSY